MDSSRDIEESLRDPLLRAPPLSYNACVTGRIILGAWLVLGKTPIGRKTQALISSILLLAAGGLYGKWKRVGSGTWKQYPRAVGLLGTAGAIMAVNPQKRELVGGLVLADVLSGVISYAVASD